MSEVDVRVKATDEGSQKIVSFGDRLAKLGMQAFGISSGLGAAKKGFDAVTSAVQGAWSALGDGAALELANSRFENLASSIGTTAAALKGDMADATQGMMSNAQMVASASDIISLGLADSGDEVVRLSNLVGQLGWDMQVLTLTMANDSMLRLDALGLSMSDVKERMEALKAAGMEANEAFDLAVIEAGEAKLALLGSAADTSAGKIKQLTVGVQNAVDAFKQEFALNMADEIDDMAGGASVLGDNLYYAALGAAELSAALFSIPIRFLADMGKTAQIDLLREQLIALGGDAQAVHEEIMKLPVDTPFSEIAVKQIEMYTAAVAAAQNQIAHDSPETKYTNWIPPREAVQESTRALGEWTTEAKEAALEAGKIGDAFAGIDMAGVAGATQSGIWAVAGNHIQSILDEAAAEAEAAHKEAAEEIARSYEEAALRMGSAFAAELNAEKKINFGDMDAMSGQAWSMAQAFGLTVEQMGNVGIALGEITPEMAEAATKAVIFQEAFGNLLGQFKAGNIDAAGLTTAFDNLISDLNSKSLVEIQVELKQKVNPVRDLWAGLPAEERIKEVEVPVKFTPEEAALQKALGMIDGIPDNDVKLITFDAEFAAVTPTATEAITTAISAIDGTVTMEPDAQAVYDVINALDQSRLTVYVDLVQGSAPELPERAMGGPVQGGSGYIIGENGPEVFVPWTSGTVVPNHKLGRDGGGEMQLSIQNYFYGQTTGADVERALDNSTRQMMRRLQQVVT